MLTETSYDDAGNYWLGSTYTYNEKNQVVTEALHKESATGIQEGYVYEYDESGREIARYRCYVALDKANAVRIFKSTYDENGNKVSEICCTPKGEETTWRYYKYIAIELPNQQKES